MKELIVKNAAEADIIDSPIPKPASDQVLIKVVISGSNPKDWKVPEWFKPMNSGDDIAGIVHAVGDNVYEFKPGDRVAAFHEMQTPHGSFAEYAIASQRTTFHIPNDLSFEDASTLPLAAMTAAVGLFLHSRLGLPEPWAPAIKPTPLVVYGAASAVGAFAIQFASLANIHPIIGIAGRGIPFAESLIDKSKGDTIIDYRDGDEAIVSGINDALKKAGVDSVSYAFDAITEHGSIENTLAVLTQGGNVTSVLPPQNFSRIAQKGGEFKYPDGINGTFTMVGCVHDDAKEFGYIYFRYLARMLFEKKFKPHPYEVVPGGLAGVSKGLTNLKSGKASAVKYIFKIADTEGAGKE